MLVEKLISKINKIGFKNDFKLKEIFENINIHYSKNKIRKLKCGNKNPNINFFVIKKSPGAGFFSNLLYILLNLMIAEKKGWIHAIDMENFPTHYNQKINTHNVKNIWELFFKKVSKYSLKEIYKSKNVYFSSSKFNFFLNDYKSKKLKRVFDKYIKIKPNINKTVNPFIKKNFKNYKVTGIHFRGTDQKTSARHAHPPTIYQITDIIDLKLKKDPKHKFFLLTEQLEYHRILIEKYGKSIFSYNFFRANSNEEFTNCKRKNHKNRLAFENLVEAITLSKCNEIVYCETNVSLFSIFYSNFSIKKIHVNNGFSSSNRFFSLFSWYIFWYFPHTIKNLFSK